MSDIKAAVICVGNKLMLDEGIGPAAYEMLQEKYVFPEEVGLFDVGCMSLSMLHYVDECDFILTVDAVDGTGEAPGTVFRYTPDALARPGMRTSLHELTLADLFDTAHLLGYECEGICIGMQVQNMDPATYQIGLTEPVASALPWLVKTVCAELRQRGYEVTERSARAEETRVDGSNLLGNC